MWMCSSLLAGHESSTSASCYCERWRSGQLTMCSDGGQIRFAPLDSLFEADCPLCNVLRRWPEWVSCVITAVWSEEERCTASSVLQKKASDVTAELWSITDKGCQIVTSLYPATDHALPRGHRYYSDSILCYWWWAVWYFTVFWMFWPSSAFSLCYLKLCEAVLYLQWWCVCYIHHLSLVC